MSSARVLAVRGVTRSFAGLTAVDRVDLDVAAGERHAVIGPNGAGKSTLVSMIAGALRPTAGDITLDGVAIGGWPAHRIARRGISRTFQHSGCFGDETLLANCLLAARATAGSPFVRLGRPDGQRRSALDALAAVGLADRAGDRAGSLSHGEARQLEFAMALAQHPRLLLADEPLAGLATAERARVGQVLKDLGRDVTVLFVEHDLDFVLGVADQVTVLDFGAVVARGDPATIRRDPRVSEVYLGDDAAASTTTTAVRAPSSGSERVMLAVEGLSAGYGAATVLDGVDLSVHEGRVVAVLGRNGMGKSTLLQAIMGTVTVRSGRIALGGEDITAVRAFERARRGLAIVPQGRGMLPNLTVSEQLLVGGRRGPWTEERVYERFPVLAERRHQPASTLSGGQQQMLAIGRALLRNPRVLLLDEPSEGLAPQLVRHVGEIVRHLADEGETIVLAEQNVRMALSVADDVAVIDRGHIVHRCAASELRDDPARQQALIGLS